MNKERREIITELFKIKLLVESFNSFGNKDLDENSLFNNIFILENLKSDVFYLELLKNSNDEIREEILCFEEKIEESFFVDDKDLDLTIKELIKKSQELIYQNIEQKKNLEELLNDSNFLSIKDKLELKKKIDSINERIKNLNLVIEDLKKEKEKNVSFKYFLLKTALKILFIQILTLIFVIALLTFVTALLGTTTFFGTSLTFSAFGATISSGIISNSFLVSLSSLSALFSGSSFTSLLGFTFTGNAFNYSVVIPGVAVLASTLTFTSAIAAPIFTITTIVFPIYELLKDSISFINKKKLSRRLSEKDMKDISYYLDETDRKLTRLSNEIKKNKEQDNN